MPTHPFTAPHLGLTVPDLVAAITWYVETLEFRLLAGPLAVREDDQPLGPAAAQIYGQGFGEFHFAHLATRDNVGLELFHFEKTKVDPGTEKFTYWRKGYNHIGLTAPDIHQTVARLEAAGGKVRTEILTIDPMKNYKIVYCEDPWGNIIEFCSHPYIEMWKGVKSE